MLATEDVARQNDRLVPGKLYIIDFDTARQFDLGPGEQPAITLPETQVSPPDGVQHFDPYSWDVYCIPDVLKEIMEVFVDTCVSARILKWGVLNPCCRQTPTSLRRGLLDATCNGSTLR